MIIIKKGTHQSLWSKLRQLIPHRQYVVHDAVILLDKSLVVSSSSDGERDWNKLTGFSLGYGYEAHHENSVRLAWRTKDSFHNWIQIASYCYINGNRVIRHIKNISLNGAKPVRLEYKLVATNGIINVIVDKIVRPECKIHYKRISNLKKCYKLLPYHGGQDKAEKDIKFNYKVLRWL